MNLKTPLVRKIGKGLGIIARQIFPVTSLGLGTLLIFSDGVSAPAIIFLVGGLALEGVVQCLCDDSWCNNHTSLFNDNFEYEEEREINELARKIRKQIMANNETIQDYNIKSYKQLQKENEKLRKQLQAVPSQTKIQKREIKEEAEMSMSM